MNIKNHMLILSARSRQQQGLTLIEIMVALLIGAFLLAGVIQIFIVNKQTYRVQENLSRMQENGRFAIDYLSRYIRLAGYIANDPRIYNDIPSSSNVSSIIENTFANPNYQIKGDNNTGLNNSDNITIRFKSDPDDYNPMTDCLGNKVAKNAIATNQFFLELNNNQPTLYCDPQHSAGKDPVMDPAKDDPKQPVIDGVENMQIRYCEEQSSDNLRCVTANNITKWNNIRSVKISLLVRSTDDRLTSQPQSYPWDANGDGKDDDPPPTPTDKYLRRVFTTTISLRNHD